MVRSSRNDHGLEAYKISEVRLGKLTGVCLANCRLQGNLKPKGSDWSWQEGVRPDATNVMSAIVFGNLSKCALAYPSLFGWNVTGQIAQSSLLSSRLLAGRPGT